MICPFSSEVVAIVVPVTCAVTPIKSSFFSLSLITALNVFCAYTQRFSAIKNDKMSIFFIVKMMLNMNKWIIAVLSTAGNKLC